MLSTLYVGYLNHQGCTLYLEVIRDNGGADESLAGVPVVREFLDVYPTSYLVSTLKEMDHRVHELRQCRISYVWVHCKGCIVDDATREPEDKTC